MALDRKVVREKLEAEDLADGATDALTEIVVPVALIRPVAWIVRVDLGAVLGTRNAGGRQFGFVVLVARDWTLLGCEITGGGIDDELLHPRRRIPCAG